MFRRDLIHVLLDRSLTLPQIAREMGEPLKDVEDALRHLLRSLKHTEYVAEVVPAECRKCEFEFSTEKLLKPSKCPKCYSTWIYPPQIGIRVKPADARE